MGQTISYLVSNLRVTVPEGKVAEKNPDRLMTVHGDYQNLDEKGKPSGDILSFHSKDIDRATVLNRATNGFDIDMAKGILTLPSGERGRKASPGITADAVAELLASLTADAEGDTAEETPAAE